MSTILLFLAVAYVCLGVVAMLFRGILGPNWFGILMIMPRRRRKGDE